MYYYFRIWKHVEKTKNKDVIICIYCQKEYKICGNTTNMLKHLKNQHPLFLGNQNTRAVKRPLENNDDKINMPKKPATVSIFV